MNLDAATISASTAALAVFYQIYRQIRADRRQERMETAAQARDVRLEAQSKDLGVIKEHVNGMNVTIERLAFKAGGDEERANPTHTP